LEVMIASQLVYACSPTPPGFTNYRFHVIAIVSLYDDLIPELLKRLGKQKSQNNRKFALLEICPNITGS
jgi:hypothetical protein